MRIVSVLASGIAEAGNGTATLYKRGTSAPAQWFRDFEGTDPATLGDVVQLDAWGSATVYVNEMAQIVVADSNGQNVRDWVDANAAPTTEVRSLSFTGTDYETGQAATGSPTTLQAVLDRWLTINGAPDWKVLVNGQPESISGALASIVGAFCNVKNPDFAGGAVGDGVNDDKDAIEAAIAACVAAGGGTVFFPAGTYRVEGNIPVDYRVSLRGTNAEVTVVTIDVNDNQSLFSLPGDASAVAGQEIRGLTLRSSQPNTSALLFWTDAVFRVVDCVLGDGGTNSTNRLAESDSDVNITRCRPSFIRTKFFPGSVRCLSQAAGPTKTYDEVIDCEFICPASNLGSIIRVSPGEVSGNKFDVTADPDPGLVAAIMNYGGVFSSNTVLGGGASEGLYAVTPPDDGDPYILVESGTKVDPTAGGPIGAGLPCDTVLSESLGPRWREIIDNGANAAPGAASAYGFELLHRTVAGAQNISIGGGFEGARFTYALWNDTVSSITFTWLGGSQVTENANQVVPANSICIYEFVAFQGQTLMIYHQVGTPVVYADS